MKPIEFLGKIPNKIISLFSLFVVILDSLLFIFTRWTLWAQQSALLFLKTIHPFEKGKSIQKILKNLRMIASLLTPTIFPTESPCTQSEQANFILSRTNFLLARIPQIDHPYFSNIQKSGSSLFISLWSQGGEQASLPLVSRSNKQTDFHISTHLDHYAIIHVRIPPELMKRGILENS
jgi:hypothetical protein